MIELSEILKTLFSSWAEIHAFETGLGIGAVVVVLWPSHRKVALSVLLGALATVFVWPTEAMRIAAQKPWYFLLGFSNVLFFGTRKHADYVSTKGLFGTDGFLERSGTTGLLARSDTNGPLERVATMRLLERGGIDEISDPDTEYKNHDTEYRS